MDMHLVGIIVMKLWWFIIPVAVGTIVGIRSDRREESAELGDSRTHIGVL